MISQENKSFQTYFDAIFSEISTYQGFGFIPLEIQYKGYKALLAAIDNKEIQKVKEIVADTKNQLVEQEESRRKLLQHIMEMFEEFLIVLQNSLPDSPEEFHKKKRESA